MINIIKGETLAELFARGKCSYSDYWSIVKGVGIVLVVIGHISSFASLHPFIYLFHLAIFFFVSGFFYKKMPEMKDFLWKKLTSLWIPFVLYGAVFILFHTKFWFWGLLPEYEKAYNFQDKLDKIFDVLSFKITEIHLVPSWFIICLFVSILLYDFLRRLSDKMKFSFKTQLLAFFVFVFALMSDCLLAADIIIPMRGIQACVILPLFWFGERFKTMINRIPLSLFFFICSFFVLFLASEIFGVRVQLNIATYPSLPLFYIVSLTGIYFTLYLAKSILYSSFFSRIFILNEYPH